MIMCGIYGYIGEKDCLLKILNGLKQLEYRGYDSAGIAGLSNGKLLSIKKAGKISVLEDKVLQKPFNLDIAIGHTRWATHGKPTTLNAHPQIDQKKELAVVHNGIIDNFLVLKQMLEKKGVHFSSDTDTEVIAQLIAFHYKNDLKKAVQKSLKLLKGNFAIAVIHQKNPDQIVVSARENPLSIGYDDAHSEAVISSDPNAFLGKTLNVMFLKNDEIGVIRANKVEIYDKMLSPIHKPVERLEAEFTPPSKEGYKYFMLKEIYEQPLTIQKAIIGRFSEENATAEFEQLGFSPKELLATKHILIIACGTSWHAGLIGASLLEEMARIPTQAEIASEIRYKNPIISNETLVIAISQSGETADTIAAVREAKTKGAKILGICNVKNSTLTRESDSCLYLKAGPEFSVCSTKAFTSQIALLTLFSLYMARLRHMDREQGHSLIQELKKVPHKIKQTLEKADHIDQIAKKYAHYDNFLFLGRRYMYATCLEAALKLKEISYVNANGCPAGEMKHGPIALIHPKHPVVAFCANKQTYEKMLSNLMEVKARGGPILAIVQEGAQGIESVADDIITIPQTSDELAVFPASVAGQLLACSITQHRSDDDIDIDKPRNLAKSVTVE
jgi:glutamine---fructose-6-phosphate transaminase (isomerizing)